MCGGTTLRTAALRGLPIRILFDLVGSELDLRQRQRVEVIPVFTPFARFGFRIVDDDVASGGSGQFESAADFEERFNDREFRMVRGLRSRRGRIQKVINFVAK